MESRKGRDRRGAAEIKRGGGRSRGITCNFALRSPSGSRESTYEMSASSPAGIGTFRGSGRSRNRQQKVKEQAVKGSERSRKGSEWQ